MVVGVMVKGVAGFGMGGSGRAKRAMPTLAAQSARVEDGAPGFVRLLRSADCADTTECGLCGYGRKQVVALCCRVG